MKKTLIALALLTSMAVSGCAVSNIPSDPNDPTFVTQLDKSKSQVKADAGVAVSVYLGLVSSDADRAKSGAVAYKVSSLVNETAKSGQLTPEQLRAYALQLIKADNSKDSQRAGLIVNAVILVIQNHLDTRFDFSNNADTRVRVARELIVAATEGVMESTSQFKTAAQPVALPRPR
jgi:hypothetical protein